MTNSRIYEKISQCAIQALLYEVTASPKPGLVDRYNCGAHKDMDIFTFMSSSAALSSYFYDCCVETMRMIEKSENEFDRYDNLFMVLRGLGLKAEKSMYEATKGVNTHKGLIFSLGLIASAATIVFYKTGDLAIDILEISEEVKKLVKELCEKDFVDIALKEVLSAGEKLYLNYGIKGIRGEAEEGFPTVTNLAYPKMYAYMQDRGHSINDILVNVLLHLMSITEDTNILSRHDMTTLVDVQKRAKEALELGGIFTGDGKAYVEHMDRDFIRRNISPGGAADLLAVTIMFYLLQR
ncbi:triphosphoribosyl-dephospho-CoA synthase CitG [Cellulosilyticum sp. I15G10I2]|uniref:triphosphoribosyl-dephospho-CoA synthase CitG n=1 Tax=Cellulosilyticum sp. I15G10I2 TaxID=1892843 RepID=UPI00085BB283|nr:triphosphoribosyl-dephospho-CoA synthase CitG [Cellulosilyticum sp. I15G10I2]